MGTGFREILHAGKDQVGKRSTTAKWLERSPVLTPSLISSISQPQPCFNTAFDYLGQQCQPIKWFYLSYQTSYDNDCTYTFFLRGSFFFKKKYPKIYFLDLFSTDQKASKQNPQLFEYLLFGEKRHGVIDETPLCHFNIFSSNPNNKVNIPLPKISLRSFHL